MSTRYHALADLGPRRRQFVVHAVAQARAFHRSFLRLLSGNLHDQRLAESARRRRDTWIDAARRAKAVDR